MEPIFGIEGRSCRAREKGVKKSVAQIAKEELLEKEQQKTQRDRIAILSALQKDHAGTLVRLRGERLSPP